MAAPEVHRPAAAVPVGRRRGSLRWLVTLAATAVSAYALDAVATVAGLLVVATGLPVLLGPRTALLLLAVSYLTWWLGLRANLRANWQLLQATGTSTNVLSKAAFDVTRNVRRERVRKAAAGAGYVGTEVVKEVPYYAGAFGTSALADSVSSVDAVTFLAGANLGAAVYELALARATGAFLRRRHASFDADWVPAAYLRDYYSAVEPDEVATIAYFTDAVRRAEPGRPMLFVGVGPTLHHVFLAAGTASEIHLADYLPANLAEIRRWLDRDPAAHDWRPFVRYTLQCEGIAAPSAVQVSEREELTRARVTRLVRLDCRVPDPAADRYACVVSAYCADSATGDKATWTPFMHNIMARVAPGGLFVTAALRRSRGYVVGGRTFPSADVDEGDVRTVLESELGTAAAVRVRRLPGDTHGYGGVVLAWGRRSA